MRIAFAAIEAVARHGGNVDIRDGSGRTPLWFAVNHNRHRAVKSLLRANCYAGPTSDSKPTCASRIKKKIRCMIDR